MEWSIYKSGGDVLCFCRQSRWNIKTCSDIITCPYCGSQYTTKNTGRYTHWKPINVTEEARETHKGITSLRQHIQRCFSKDLLQELKDSGKWEELDELCTIIYEGVLGNE